MISFAEAPVEPQMCITCTAKRISAAVSRYRKDHDLPGETNLKMVVDQITGTIQVKAEGFPHARYTYQELDG